MKKLGSSLMITTVVSIMLVSGCGSKKSPEAVATDQAVSGNDQTETQLKPLTPDPSGLLPADKAIPAPQWSMADLDGNMKSLADFKGNVVILDFWDTWCPPCKKEIPGFVELQDKYGEKGLTIIGAAFGRNGKEAVSDFAIEYSINYPVLLATPAIAQLHGGIRSIPTTFMIDREGQLRGIHVGYVPKEVFEEQILALL